MACRKDYKIAKVKIFYTLMHMQALHFSHPCFNWISPKGLRVLMRLVRKHPPWVIVYISSSFLKNEVWILIIYNFESEKSQEEMSKRF